MIKVHNRMLECEKNPIAEVICRDDVINELRKTGIDLGVHDQYDLILDSDDNKNPEAGTVVYERIDGCYIKSSNRALLENRNVVKLVKNYMYEDHRLNNTTCYNQRPFTSLLRQGGTNPVRIVRARDYYRKVMTGISFLHYNGLQRAEDVAAMGPVEKTVDLFFAGTVDRYGSSEGAGELISEHRRLAVRKMREYGEKNGLITEIYDGKKMPVDEYMQMLACSKVTVSPWGWGEPCYREYEALMNRCICVKPFSWRYISTPDVRDMGGLMWCAPNFSDLDVVLDCIFRDYDMIGICSKMLIKCRQADVIAEILSGIFREAFNEN